MRYTVKEKKQELQILQPKGIRNWLVLGTDNPGDEAWTSNVIVDAETFDRFRIGDVVCMFMVHEPVAVIADAQQNTVVLMPDGVRALADVGIEAKVGDRLHVSEAVEFAIDDDMPF